MKTKSTSIIKQNQDITNIFLITGFILLIPLFGKWPWTLSDFVIAGVLLVGAGLMYVLAARKFSKHRAIIGFVVAIAFLLIWAELAVGIFGSPIAGS